MSNPIVKIVNATTGEVIEREMTAAELEQSRKDSEAILAHWEQVRAKEAARLAVLEKLGLTAEEAAALLG